MVFDLHSTIRHSEHGEQKVDFVLWNSGWRAYTEHERECDDRQDYLHEGLYRKGEGPLLNFAEVCEWLTRKGWAFVAREAVTTIKYSRGETTAEGVVEHRSKDGRVKIIADSRDEAIPTIYRVWVGHTTGANQIKPPPKPRQRKFYDGWWRLKDAKQAAINHINSDPLPFSGTKPRVERYDTYDPDEEGYGSEEQWRATFDARVSQNEADKILGGESPESVLELSPGATQAQIKRAYRRLIAKHHPDKHGGSKAATVKATRIKAAFDLLRD
jgi:hypothetical protein